VTAFADVDALLERGVDTGVFPGAVLHVRREAEALFEAAVGHTRGGGPRVDAATHFDLASVSKVVGTTALAMRLVYQGRIALDDPAGRWVPGFDASDRAAITLRHLLAHTSGLPAWRPLYEPLRGLALAGRFAEARQRLLDAVAAEPLATAPGTRCEYSDLGFLALGAALEAAGGARLDALWEAEVRWPLGLSETFYVDILRGRPPGRFAATERCPWRGDVLEGVVHDDHAYVLGGVAGHAGLFSTARAVGAFGSALLEAEAGRFDWIPREIVETFWTPDPFGIGATYALGWDTPSPGASQAGTRMRRAVGHLGYTGTSLWIDRERRLVVVLLTNRVHPTRENDRIREFRPLLHDAVVDAADSG
jgi:CubicO group peptidase (beta-lactamase class C family)